MSLSSPCSNRRPLSVIPATEAWIWGCKTASFECPLPRHCVALEDSPTGATAAVAAGVHTIGILTSQTAEAMGKIGVTHTIRDYRDLLREIEA